MESTNLEHVVIEKLDKNKIASGSAPLIMSEQEIQILSESKSPKTLGYRISRRQNFTHHFQDKTIAVALDLGFLLWGAAFLVESFEIFPRPTLFRMLALLGVSIGFSSLTYPWTKSTVGQWVTDPSEFDQPRSTLIKRIVSFAIVYGIGGLLFLSSVPFHPGLQSFKLESLPVYLPEATGVLHQVLSLYYSMGALPTKLGTNPLYLEMPYAKGPPQQFIGAVKIKMGAAELTVEGPKTPRAVSATEIQNCLALSPAPAACLKLREEVLGRHLREMRARLGISTFKGSFFEVSNPALREQDQPRGIKLVSQNRTHGETRYILINQEGTQQTFALRYPILRAEKDPESTAQVAAARDLLDQWIQSSRLAPEIHSPRAWMSSMLSEQNLQSLQNTQSLSEFEEKIARIQAQLIAHITVSPSKIAPYFHLAGTYTLLAKKAHGQTAYLETMERAKRGVLSSLRYARDVANLELQSDRNELRQIESMWAQVKAL